MNNAETTTTATTLRGRGIAPFYRTSPTIGSRVIVTCKRDNGFTGVITGWTWGGDAIVDLDNGTTDTFYLPSLDRI